MIHKIENFNESVPFGAQYVGVLNERNGVLSVQYFIDSEGRNPAYSHSLQNLVMEKDEFAQIVGNVSENALHDFAGWVGNVIGGAIRECVLSAAKGAGVNPPLSGESCEMNTYIVSTQENVATNLGQADDKDGVLRVDVAELWTRSGEQLRQGDTVETLPNTSYSGTLTVVEYVGPGRAVDNEDALHEYYDEYNPQSSIAESKEEAMPKLDDTTKVAGQNTRKLRKADKAGKQIKDDEYYADGEDNKGPLRFPHSDAEKQFYDAHGELKIHDYPGNTKNWMTTVTNKDMNAKIKLGEDNAPLSSSEDSFFLTEYSTFVTLKQVKKQNAGDFFKEFNVTEHNKQDDQLQRDMNSRKGSGRYALMWDFSYNNGRIVKAKDYSSRLSPTERDRYRAKGADGESGQYEITYLSKTYVWKPDVSYTYVNGLPPPETPGTLYEFGKKGKNKLETTSGNHLTWINSKRNKVFYMKADSFLENLNSGASQLNHNAQEINDTNQDADVFVKHMP